MWKYHLKSEFRIFNLRLTTIRIQNIEIISLNIIIKFSITK